MNPVHIRAEPGQVAERVLLPGDPRRARHIAETFFEAPELVTEERGMLGFTGTYKGERVSVQASGMGCPSLSIAVEELIMLGAKTILRVGTCGAYAPQLALGDVVIATAAAPDDGTVHTYTKGLPYAPAATFEVVRALVDAVGDGASVGPIVSSDVFYHPERERWEQWSRLGLLAVEMESSALFTIAAMHGVRAGTILVVSDTLHTTQIARISDEALRAGVDDMVRAALDAIISL